MCPKFGINYYYRQKLGTVGRLLLQGHSRRPKNEDNRRVSARQQSITSESTAVNMTQQIETRKRALHARMSHITVCNTTVSTNKTRRTLMK